MLRATVHLLLTFSVVFYLFCSFTNGAKIPCPYSSQNLSLVYKNCSATTNVTALTLNFKHGSFSKLEANLKEAFESYCNHIPDINACVQGQLTSDNCEKSVYELYVTLTTKSNDFCGESGGLKGALMELLQVSRPLDLVTINRCKPSNFDFSLCQRFADMTRNEQISVATAERPYDETDYLLEINLCVYSSVFVGCPADAAILTLLYEIEEWIPPHLDSNTTEVLNVLHSRDTTFY